MSVESTSQIVTSDNDRDNIPRIKLRRGRPLKSDEADLSTDKRRARGRKAQQAYRLRKDASLTMLEERARMLENVIEDMSSMFADFIDVLLASYAVRNDPNLSQRLIQLTHQLLALARRANHDSDSEGQYTGDGYKNSTPNNENLPLLPSLTVDDAAAPRQPDELVNTEDYGSYNSFHSQKSASVQSPRISCADSKNMQCSPDIRQPPSASPTWEGRSFDYVWCCQRPSFAPKLQPARSLNPELALRKYPLGYTLLHTTLSVAYHSLRGDGAPNRLAKSMFRYALSWNSQEQILRRLRWYLGPGSHEAPAFGALDFSGKEESKRIRDFKAPAIKSGPILPPQSLQGDFVMEASWVNSDDKEEYLSAYRVEEYLKEQGAVYIGKDEVRLVLPSSEPSILSPRRGSHAHPTTRVLEAFNFRALLGGEPLSSREYESSGRSSSSLAQPPPRRPRVGRVLRLNTHTLVMKLTEMAICLDIGPGYPRSMLEQAIAASVVEESD
ncbi:hypothetical protein AOQ84DRAFT_426447 [Glonium stellatum]|uniref:BZIP domain-containing protein n=1 Tax=Glonium stellatum TaxID=574774 RepID=A0A8E2F5T3_9PEZI|nr:hypothetical protein AOQ84DRAFT_426447 [Glonium stellatum]